MMVVMIVMVCDNGRCVAVRSCVSVFYSINYYLFVLCGTCGDVMSVMIIAITHVVSLLSPFHSLD